MSARPRSLPLVAALAILAALPASASAASCRVPQTQDQGLGIKDGYVTELRVAGTSCRRGKEVVRAFHRCRYDNGGRRGRCSRAVLGYSCREARREGTPGSFGTSVTCRRGDARVFHRYTQFT